MSETHMKQRIDLDALEAALGKSTPGEARLLPNGGAKLDEVYAQRLVVSYNALPALIAELRELRARVTPEPISDKHKDGHWWLVWNPGSEQWMKCLFDCQQWNKSGTMRESLFGTPTHALPMPPAPEAV